MLPISFLFSSYILAGWLTDSQTDWVIVITRVWLCILCVAARLLPQWQHFDIFVGWQAVCRLLTVSISFVRAGGPVCVWPCVVGWGGGRAAGATVSHMPPRRAPATSWCPPRNFIVDWVRTTSLWITSIIANLVTEAHNTACHPLSDLWRRGTQALPREMPAASSDGQSSNKLPVPNPKYFYIWHLTFLFIYLSLNLKS